MLRLVHHQNCVLDDLSWEWSCVIACEVRRKFALAGSHQVSLETSAGLTCQAPGNLPAGLYPQAAYGGLPRDTAED